MGMWVTVVLTTFALLAGLGLGYEVRDRRFIEEIRNELRAEIAEQRDYLADRIDDLENAVAESPTSED